VIANTPEAWTERAREAETSAGAALWSEAGQRERFAAVLAALDPRPGETLLDYGCGTAALSELLPVGVEYVGCDWSRGMIERARREHPSRELLLRGDFPTAPVDLAVVVGTFNLDNGWAKSQTWDALGRLWSLCRRALAACLYAGDDPDCLVYTQAEVEAFAAETDAARFAVTQPRPNDLLLLLER
jgi:SAM-dependent methyltransferase